jgi:DNA-binding MarR family transcriptional regulator
MLSRRVALVYNAALRPYGITASQYVLLCEIARSGENAHDMAQRLVIEKSTMCRNLRSLERLDAIKQGPRSGRRGRKIELTEKGIHLVEVCAAPWRKADITMERSLDELMKLGLLAAAE